MQTDAEVAAKLTERQRERLIEWSERQDWFTALPSSERREFRGLVERAGYSANRLSARGLRVVQHLKQENAK